MSESTWRGRIGARSPGDGGASGTHYRVTVAGALSNTVADALLARFDAVSIRSVDGSTVIDTADLDQSALRAFMTLIWDGGHHLLDVVPWSGDAPTGTARSEPPATAGERSVSGDEVMVAPREWDAFTYDSLPLPHDEWGQDVLGSLELRGDERVIDLGAGTGRDTAALLRRLPRGHVIAVDGSAAMLAQLRTRLSETSPERLTVLRADLSRPLRLSEPVDAVVSVATLHWLSDHQNLFRRLLDVLRPGGVLRAEWGGAGDVAGVDDVLEELGLPRLDGIAHYATVEQTSQRLRTARFVEVRVRAVDGVVRMPTGPRWEAFLRTVVLGPVLDRLPSEQHEHVVTEVAHRLAGDGVRYVRLQADARRPS